MLPECKLAALYGITRRFVEMMTKDQDGKCALCGNPPDDKKKTLQIDHCHKEGMVRGLLCINCNLGLGHFKHDPALLHAAIKYLEHGPYQRKPRKWQRRK